MRKNLIRWLKIVLITGLLFCFGVLSVNYYIKTAGQRHINNLLTQVEAAETAIVLGARVYSSGNPSPMLADRLDTAIDLYHNGKVSKLLLTGDHGQKSYDEVNAMRQYTEDQGVPPEDIFLDHAGFSTYDSMYRARDIFQVKSAVVITQRFHLPRAVFTANQMGIEAAGLVADRHTYPGEAYYELREILARNKAFLQLFILKSSPKYLGPVIPITGDGRSTWDEL